MGVKFDSNKISGTSFTAHPDKEFSATASLPFELSAFELGTFRARIWRLLRINIGFAISPFDDKWSLLRRNYTGTKLVLVWMALVGVAFPQIAVGLWLYFLSDLVGFVERYLDIDQTAFRDFRGTWEQMLDTPTTMPVWRVMLGLTDVNVGSVFWSTLTVVLLLYAIGRFRLTLWVDPLRNAESRSNRTPAKEDYQRPYTMHRFLAPVGVVAVVLAVWNGARLLWWIVTASVPAF